MKIERAYFLPLLLVGAVALPANRAIADGADAYIGAVRTFADSVLKYGKDVYGPRHTPLFVDGLNVDTREPVKWKRKGEVWTLSNQATQQVLFRTLDGLTKLTGEPKYREAATAAIRYAFDNLCSPNGLLYWGGHWCYDAATEKQVGEAYRHELKCNYPYYDLMWEVDPKATRQFIKAFWNAHILDWSNLDMNRHGSYTKEMGNLWASTYKGGKVFFVGKGLTFVNTGSDLFYAAAMLHKFTDEQEPLVWAKRMAHRYVETRNRKTGLGGYQYSRVARDRAQEQFGPDFGDRILEGTILEPHRARTKNAIAGICQLKLGETLGDAGKDFLQWALEDLTAYGHQAYKAEDNTFLPMISDGTILTGFVMKRDGYYGEKGSTFEPAPADTLFFWAYALAYRLSGDKFMWEMARSIGRGNDLGDIGASPGDAARLNIATRCSDPQAIFGLLDLYKNTGDKSYLKLAQRVGDNVLNNRLHNGFFVPSKEHLFARFDSVEALALLHLAATIRGKPDIVPGYYAEYAKFHCPYDGIGRTYDTVAIYDRRRK